MRKDYRQCATAGAFNTGVTPCPLQPDKISGIILVQHGQKLPADITAESLLEACHADYPGRLYPILGVVEYAVSGGEANTSATGYGPNRITGYSARTDTFTLDQFNFSLRAMLVRAKSSSFDMYPFDYNNVIYGMDDGTDSLAGIPLAGVYPTGQEYTSSGQVAYIAFNAMTWTLGVYAITGEKKRINALKIILNPPTLAVIVALPFFFCNVAVPEQVMTPISYLGDMTLPLSMIILGVRLADMKPIRLINDVKVYVSSFIKLILAPLLSLAVMLLVSLLVPIDRYVMVALYVIAAMPAASSALNFAEMYNGDRETAAACTLMSTILCILTIPVLMLLCSVLI